MHPDMPHINKKDVVWLNISSSSINHVNVNVPAIMYDENVQAASNLTQPSRHGLRGILYTRNDSCNRTSMTPPFFNQEYQRALPRIALITSGGPCTFVDKIRLAQQDGAIGAIIYNQPGADTKNSSNYIDDGTMYVPADTEITIPAFHVDPRIGPQLSRHVLMFAQQGTSTVQQAVRVLMLPGSSRGPNPWEMTLIVMSALLAIGFLTSVIMHCHLLRKNRRLRERVEQGLVPPTPDMLPMGKQLLDESQLSTLPTRTIGGSDAVPDGHAIRRRASRVSSILLKKVSTAAAPAPAAAAPPINKKQDDEEDLCAICLEKVEHGDMVRQLPCTHEFHCECIDPWLTSKAAECPLCKYDCSQPFVPRVQPGEAGTNESNDHENTFVSRMRNLLFPRRRHEENLNNNDAEQQPRQQPPQQQQQPFETIELSSAITISPSR
ncbi:hypothetical protein BDB00DRAFT_871020 [Zychaea mexicana]|uniref:uncharacterized protein n=1 Tax=Zychaea mexicana TaxID=64656 RepID=UPI0022FDFA91|nr:uncharacterized protein BDB00DRAFT_871020 [Zychaea mexicana]KAI9494739.1 hypothetical protein BDB00DRAFT_871020 [Zychaea mexicana]